MAFTVYYTKAQVNNMISTLEAVKAGSTQTTFQKAKSDYAEKLYYAGFAWYLTPVGSEAMYAINNYVVAPAQRTSLQKNLDTYKKWQSAMKKSSFIEVKVQIPTTNVKYINGVKFYGEQPSAIAWKNSSGNWISPS